VKECLFCKIASGEIPAKVVYKDEQVIAFEDIKPQAPVHIIIIPRTHIETIADMDTDNSRDLVDIFEVSKRIATDKNILEKGYRLVINCREDGGQEIYHMHIHLLGGRKIAWPPG